MTIWGTLQIRTCPSGKAPAPLTRTLETNKQKAINGFLLLKDKFHNFCFAFSAKLMKLRQAYSSKFGTKACSGTRQSATSGLRFKVFN